MNRMRSGQLRRIVAAALVAAMLPCAVAQRGSAAEEIQDITIIEQLDGQLPLDLKFHDSNGRAIRLGDLFETGRPVILTMNYYRCPMLCGLMLNGMVDALKEVDLEPGEDYQIVTISFDPLEKPALAKAKKENYVAYFGRPEAAMGWKFLTGDRDAIHALTKATGFRYRWVESKKEWAHPSALIICTPEGHISRYLGGVYFEPDTVRLTLIEASNNRIGSLFDQVFLSCFHYTPSDGKYTANVWAIMRLGGATSVVLLGLMLTAFWRLELRRRRMVAAAEDTAGEVSHT